MLNVLNVNFNDVVGGQFNNFEYRNGFNDYGVSVNFFVHDKLSDEDCVTRAWSKFRSLRRYVQSATYRLERYLSIQSLLYMYPLLLFRRKCFTEADVAHYHILHNGWFSMLAMPWLTRNKATVWTIHDPWLLTGHCVYPTDCERWKIGCGECPYLNYQHALRKDRTYGHFRLKQRMLPSLPVKFVVASEWMRKMVEVSPIGKDLDVTVIPFGVDLENFKPRDNAEIRQSLGIPEENIVLFFRSNMSEFKGISYVHEAMSEILTKSKKPITLLTVEGMGHFDKYIGKCQIVENPWEHDVERLASFYNACDIFLMPSVAEAFGLMAIEAMASGKPVVFFKGTSLDEVTFAPRAGVGAKMSDAADLALVISDLVNNDEKRLQMSKEARLLAEEHYDVKMYLQNMSNLYKEAYYSRIASKHKA